MRWILAAMLAFVISGCSADMDEYLDEARRFVDPAQRMWPGSREPAESQKQPTPAEEEAPPEEPRTAQVEPEKAEPADEPEEEKGAASDPTRIVFRYTDDAGNLKFVAGIDSVPPKYRPRVRVVDGRKLNTYQSGPAPAPVASSAAPSASSTLRGRPGGEWNSNQIRWVPLSQAKTSARRLQRPVLLVVYTDWCPHCKEFETQFEDQQVAELAQRFVMARGNSDEMDVLDRSYAPDGRYIPRMLVLSPTGKLDTELNDGGEDAYYWGSTSPKGILRAMRKAIKKYGN
ncbi:MAG: thioredoxin family protein [Chrysiogenetes bacterium]|nr:thioredoxin family protein [Chrysiogenetes bacterium]